MLAILKREFKSYFHTLIGPIAIDILLVLTLLFFQMYNVMYGYNNLSNTLYNLSIYGITFAVPILAMRVFADEKKNKSDQLILTSPVSVGKIVLGKFLALAATIAIPFALICILPPIMNIFGSVPMKFNYVTIAVIFLYSLMVISISMFMSALTETAAIAAVLSIIVTFLGLVLGNFYSNISIEWLANALSSVYDFGTRLVTVLNGTLDLSVVAYFVTVTLLFLFLTCQVILKRRYSFSKNTFSVGAYSAVTSIVMVVLVVFVNLAANQIPDGYREIDITDNGINSLTDDSIEVAKSIEDSITIYMLSSEDDSNTYRDMIVKNAKLYAFENSNITFEFVDPIENPTFASEYTDETLSDYSLIIVNNDNGRSYCVDFYDFFELEYSYTSTYVSGYDIEGQITNALQYVTLSEDSLVNAYILTGHNEVTLDDTFSELLSKSNIESTELNLKTSESVPDDCSLLIINAPTADLQDDEVTKIEDYIDNGGALLIITSYQTATTDMSNFEEVLAYYGVTNSKEIIYENDMNYYYSSNMQGSLNYYLFPITNSSSDITSEFGDANNLIFAPLATALSFDEDSSDVTYTKLLYTSDSANLMDISSSEASLSDESASYVLGLECVKTISDDVTSTCIIYTSDQLFTYDVDYVVNGSNQALFSNTISALVTLDTDSVFVSIPVESADETISMTASALATIQSVWWLLIAVILIWGIVVWAKRRKA